MIDPLWFYIACFVIMLMCVPLVEWCDKRNLRSAGPALLVLMVLTSVVIFAKGLSMSMNWSDPFVGKYTEVSKTVHNANGLIAVGILSIWPYFLMALGGFFGIGGALLLKRRLQISN